MRPVSFAAGSSVITFDRLHHCSRSRSLADSDFPVRIPATAAMIHRRKISLCWSVRCAARTGRSIIEWTNRVTSSAISSRWSDVGRHVERGPGSLDQPAGEQQRRAARHVIGGCTGTEPRQLTELGVPGEPLEEQAANLRHHLGRGGTEIDVHGSDTSPERLDRFQCDRQEHGLSAGVVPIDGRAAHAQLACHLSDPHVDPAAVDAPASGVTNPLSRFRVVRRRSASPAGGDLECTVAGHEGAPYTLCTL